MWIMIVMSSYFSAKGYSGEEIRVSPSMVTIEFSSRERCINAVKFTKQQPKVYNAFCVQK